MVNRQETFERIKKIIEHETGVRSEKLSLETTLFGDLFLDGDDADEFFRALAKEFQIDLSALDLSRHFGNEGGFSVNTSFFPFSQIMKLLRIDRHKFFHKEPIKLDDLVRAVEFGKWPAP